MKVVLPKQDDHGMISVGKVLSFGCASGYLLIRNEIRGSLIHSPSPIIYISDGVNSDLIHGLDPFIRHL